RQLRPHGARLLLAPDEERASGRGIEKRVRGIDVVGPDRQLEAAETVLDTHAARARRRDAPRLLVGLLDRELPPVLVDGTQPVHVALVLANEIAARRPNREAHLHRGGTARVGLERDL